uniref:Bac_surface_Ag domain-containing protein n=1 Tax=Macrostomum lignano TaxID=282301 RepID=A0A1I8JQK8_9PLAT
MLLQWSRQKAIHKRVEEQFKSNNNMPTAKLNPDPEMHAFVERVHVKGPASNRDQLVHSQIGVATWGQLVLEIQAAKRVAYKPLAVFTRVDVTIDTAKSPRSRTSSRLSHAAYEVVFEVQECKQMQYGVRTMAGMDGTVSLVLNGNLRNLTGNAERLIFDYQIGESHSSCFASFSLPLGPTEQLLRAELIRDSATVPMSGGLMRLTSELAGFGGDVRHLRLGAKLSRSLPLAPLFPAASIHLTAACGHAVPMNGGGIPLADRFTIGGLSSGLRGFDINCVGPQRSQGRPIRWVQKSSSSKQHRSAQPLPTWWRVVLHGWRAPCTARCLLVTRRGNFFDLFRVCTLSLTPGCLVSNAGGAPPLATGDCRGSRATKFVYRTMDRTASHPLGCWRPGPIRAELHSAAGRLPPVTNSLRALVWAFTSIRHFNRKSNCMNTKS